MPTNNFQEVCNDLRDLGGQRVWSLLVTLFGDLAAKPGTTLSGPTLTLILQGLDIRPEAMRVALHRLRKDGWIQSEKSGRESFHKLSPYGAEETQKASYRIYARTSSAARAWYIALANPGAPDPHETMMRAGYTQIHNRLYIGVNPNSPPESTLVLKGESVPDWLRGALAPTAQLDGYSALYAQLKRADANLFDAASYSAAERAMFRCLIVHNWRRLILKHPDLPAEIFPKGWRGADCRDLVHRLLDHFPRPDLSEI